jgi:hypothetical protein
VDDDIFASVDAYTGNPSECADNVKEKIASFYTLTRTKLEANSRQKPYADCVIGEITNNEGYQNLMLKATAIELKGVGLKFWKISNKNARVKDLETKAQDIVSDAIVKCKGQIDFGAFFDTFFTQKSMEVVGDDIDFCTRKYLVDKNVIQVNQFENFNLNPKNIRVNNCDEIMRNMLESLKAQASAGVNKQCVIDNFIQNGYIDLIMKIQMISKLNLKPTEKNAERQMFINQMISMTHKIFNC